MFKKNRKKQIIDEQNSEQVKEKPKSYYDEAMEWEISRTYLSAQSERKAWKISVFLCLLLLGSWLGLFFMLPLKRDIPYVIQVDNAVGRMEVSQVYNPRNLSFNEVRDKYWINNFINLFEKYNFYTLTNDYQDMQLFASDAVFEDYRKMYSGESARQKNYKDDLRIKVDVISILIRPSRDGTYTASVRFSLSQVGMKLKPGEIINSKIYTAEVVYHYERLALDEHARLVNPLGFNVISYQLAADN